MKTETREVLRARGQGRRWLDPQLRQAIVEGDLECVRSHLSSHEGAAMEGQADGDERDDSSFSTYGPKRGESPLEVAVDCMAPSPEMVQLLLGNGARPDGPALQPPLILAARHPDPAIPNLLLDAGADPTVCAVIAAEDGETTPVVRAVRCGSVDTVRTLLARGCPPDTLVRDRRGTSVTALLIAATQPSLEMARVLVEGGAGLGGGVLRCAVACEEDSEDSRDERLSLVRLLVAKGADPFAASEPTFMTAREECEAQGWHAARELLVHAERAWTKEGRGKDSRTPEQQAVAIRARDALARVGRLRHGEGKEGSTVYIRSCSQCGKPERTEDSLKQCARCHTTCYCDKACQAAHWKAGHKRVCIASDK